MALYMKAIYIKELRSFFNSIMGYVVIVLYLVINGLFLWVFPDSSIIDFGYASLGQYFNFAPWVLMFLISAITMRMYSDEFRSGNIEILDTLPIPSAKVMMGKYWASLTLIVISILPTLVYIYSINKLAYIPGSLDYGAMFGSYIGLLLLAAAYTAIGLFSSTVSQNQIVCFLISLAICFLFYTVMDSLSLIPAFANGLDYILEQIGMSFHYQNVNKGLLDSRDIVYFLSLVVFFLYLCYYSLQRRKMEKPTPNEE